MEKVELKNLNKSHIYQVKNVLYENSYQLLVHEMEKFNQIRKLYKISCPRSGKSLTRKYYRYFMSRKWKPFNLHGCTNFYNEFQYNEFHVYKVEN